MYQDITHDLYMHHFKSSYRFDLSIVPWLEKEHILIKPTQVMHARSFSCVRLFATLWTVAHQAPLSMGFFQSRILEWVAIFLFHRIFLTQGSNLCLLHCQAGSFLLSHQGDLIKGIPKPPWPMTGVLVKKRKFGHRN